MSCNPYFIEGPALISFSGGRTSGYMLRHIIEAFDGVLPEDVFVCFADTGKEHAATYEFVDECALRWGVTIHRVAYDRGNHETPYDALIERKSYLPNPVARFCTQELKVKPLAQFMRDRGFDYWTNVVGLRADEPRRVAKLRGRQNPEWDIAVPLADVGVSEDDILKWWGAQPFDLGIPRGFGNCVGCFLKARSQLITIEQSEPGSLAWWAQKERQIGGTFRSDRDNYATLIDFAERQGALSLDESLTECFCHD